MVKVQQEDLRGSILAQIKDAEISSEREDNCSMLAISLMTLGVGKGLSHYSQEN